MIWNCVGSSKIYASFPEGSRKIRFAVRAVERRHRCLLSRECSSITLCTGVATVNAWRNELRNGKMWLSRHRPSAAIRCFEEGLSIVPPTAKSARSELLFYNSIALRLVGQKGRAIAQMIDSYRCRKSKHVRRILIRTMNGYGMPRQTDPQADDECAFYSIHLARYLTKKKSRRLETRAEADMIHELIDDSWRTLTQANDLTSLGVSEKLNLFRAAMIIFPYIELPNRLDDSVVHVDFDAKRRIEADDRCPCGSGFPFARCCGRIPAEDELLGGKF